MRYYRSRVLRQYTPILFAKYPWSFRINHGNHIVQRNGLIPVHICLRVIYFLFLTDKEVGVGRGIFLSVSGISDEAGVAPSASET